MALEGSAPRHGVGGHWAVCKSQKGEVYVLSRCLGAFSKTTRRSRDRSHGAILMPARSLSPQNLIANDAGHARQFHARSPSAPPLAPETAALLETANRLQAQTELLHDSTERLREHAVSLRSSTARLRILTDRLASDLKEQEH